MTFTALEALLLAAFVSMIVGLFIRMKGISPAECMERRKANEEIFKNLSKAIRGIRIANNIQFRMLREMIARSKDLTNDDKARILNTSADGDGEEI